MIIAGLSTLLMLATSSVDEGRSRLSPFVGLGVGPGISLNDAPASFQLSLRGGVRVPLTDRLSLGGFLPVRLMTTGEERNGIRTSTFNYSFVPTGRGSVELVDRLRAYMDLGVGVAFFNHSSDVPFLGEVRSSLTAAEINTGVGVEYAPHQNVALFFEPMSLRIFTAGSGTATVGRFSSEVEQDGAVVWGLMFGAHMMF